MLSNCFSLSAYYQKEISHFSKMLFLLLLPGWGKGIFPTKKAEGVLTFNWVDPDQNKCFTSAPVSLHSSTPWLEIAHAHTQLKSPSSSLHCPGGKEQGPSPALFKHIASSRFLPVCHTFLQIPEENERQSLPAGFQHRIKRHSFIFSLLLYMGLSLKHSLTLKERHPTLVPPEKEARGILFLHPTVDGIWDTCCHRKGQQQYTHPEGGQIDRHI